MYKESLCVRSPALRKRHQSKTIQVSAKMAQKQNNSSLSQEGAPSEARNPPRVAQLQKLTSPVGDSRPQCWRAQLLEGHSFGDSSPQCWRAQLRRLKSPALGRHSSRTQVLSIGGAQLRRTQVPSVGDITIFYLTNAIAIAKTATARSIARKLTLLRPACSS